MNPGEWEPDDRVDAIGDLPVKPKATGKTLQALCAVRGRTLVVAPTSVMHNWRDELRRHRPDLRCSLYHGPLRELDDEPGVTLTTYGVLRGDAELLGIDARALRALLLGARVRALLHQRYNVSREAQDEFAALSNERAANAIKDGRLADEIVAVAVPQRKGDPIVFDTDENPRAGTTAEKLAGMRPAFKKDGTVTAGNASALNDGAAVVMLCSADKARELGLTPLATIKASSNAGVDPKIMGIGPVPATRALLDRLGLVPFILYRLALGLVLLGISL